MLTTHQPIRKKFFRMCWTYLELVHIPLCSVSLLYNLNGVYPTTKIQRNTRWERELTSMEEVCTSPTTQMQLQKHRKKVVWGRRWQNGRRRYARRRRRSSERSGRSGVLGVPFFIFKIKPKTILSIHPNYWVHQQCCWVHLATPLP